MAMIGDAVAPAPMDDPTDLTDRPDSTEEIPIDDEEPWLVRTVAHTEPDDVASAFKPTR